MSSLSQLRPAIESVSRLLQDAINLISQYSWIYDTKMTEVFITQPWKHMDSTWLDFLQTLSMKEIHDLPTTIIENGPDTLQVFFNQARLCDKRSDKEVFDECSLPEPIKIGMGKKKQHEIARLAPFIDAVMTESGSNVVIDIGCGLGYLGNVLNSHYQRDVIGLEMKDKNCHSAIQRLSRKEMRIKSADSAGSMSQSEHRSSIHQLSVDGSYACSDSIRQILSSSSSGADAVCMAGLHCCGDLTPATLMQFLKMEECLSLVCFSCCYHRMSCDSGGYSQFPMSQTAHNILGDKNPMNQYALRLACQETKARWLSKNESDHTSHQRQVAYRAIYEYYCHKTGRAIKMTSKRLVPSAGFDSFDCYVSALISRMSDSHTDPQRLRSDLLECYAECEHMIQYIEWYTALQVLIQAVLETIILRDRQLYLLEQGVLCKLIAVFDDGISPRNVALVATRPAAMPVSHKSYSGEG